MSARWPVLALRAVVALLALGTLNGLWRMASDRPAILEQFPGAVSPLYEAMFAAGVAGLVAAVGLSCLRRWALWLYYGVVAAMLVLDEWARAPRLHQAAVLTGAALIGACAWAARRSLLPRKQ